MQVVRISGIAEVFFPFLSSSSWWVFKIRTQNSSNKHFPLCLSLWGQEDVNQLVGSPGWFVIFHGKLERSERPAASFPLLHSSPSHCVTGFTKNKNKKKKNMCKFLNCINTWGNLYCIQQSSQSFGNLVDRLWHQQGTKIQIQLKVHDNGSVQKAVRLWYLDLLQIPLTMSGLGPISYIYKLYLTRPPLMRFCCVPGEAFFLSFSFCFTGLCILGSLCPIQVANGLN